MDERSPNCAWMEALCTSKTKSIIKKKKKKRKLQASSSLHQKDAKLNLEVGAFVDIKILWWIHNRPIVHGKIFVIKLISNWWRGRLANEINPRGNIKWRKPYGSVKRKYLYGKFLLNEILIKFIYNSTLNKYWEKIPN